MNRKFKSWNLKYFVTLLTSILSLLINLLHIRRKKVLIYFLHIPCSASCSWPSDRFYSSCHTRGELSVHAWLQPRTMRQKTHSLFTNPTIRFASLSWACLSGEAGVSLQLLFSMCYSAAGKCIAQAAASWCHNVGLCSKVLIVLLRGQAEISPPTSLLRSLSRQSWSRSGFVFENEDVFLPLSLNGTFYHGSSLICVQLYNLPKGISALSPPGTEIKISTE